MFDACNRHTCNAFPPSLMGDVGFIRNLRRDSQLNKHLPTLIIWQNTRVKSLLMRCYFNLFNHSCCGDWQRSLTYVFSLGKTLHAQEFASHQRLFIINAIGSFHTRFDVLYVFILIVSSISLYTREKTTSCRWFSLSFACIIYIFKWHNIMII